MSEHGVQLDEPSRGHVFTSDAHVVDQVDRFIDGLIDERYRVNEAFLRIKDIEPVPTPEVSSADREREFRLWLVRAHLRYRIPRSEASSKGAGGDSRKRYESLPEYNQFVLDGRSSCDWTRWHPLGDWLLPVFTDPRPKPIHKVGFPTQATRVQCGDGWLKVDFLLQRRERRSLMTWDSVRRMLKLERAPITQLLPGAALSMLTFD